MIRFKLLIIASILIFSAVNSSGQKEVTAGLIGFYNLENLFDTLNTNGQYDLEFSPGSAKRYNTERYFEKLDNLSMVISKIGSDDGIHSGPAILGVSEIENITVLEDLVAHPNISDRGYKIIHYDSPDLRGVDVGLLYQPTQFTPVHTDSYNLDLRNPEGGRIYSRDQLLVSGLFDGEEMHFIVGHWPSRRGGEKRSIPLRMAAAELSRYIADSILNLDPNAKIIIMGDLNDDPIDKSVKHGLKASGKMDGLKEGELYNCMYPLFKKGIGTLAYRDAWNLFDQIIISQGLLNNDYKSYQLYTTKVYNHESLLQKDGRFKGYPFRTYVGDNYMGGFSDHFPVYIIIAKER